MGILRNPDGSPSDLVDKWYPNGYKSELQATPVGLTAELIDSLTGGINPDFASLELRVAALEVKLNEVETALGLHENNGEHWTGQQIDNRAQDLVDAHNTSESHKTDSDVNGLIDTKITAHTDAFTHTPVE